MRSIVEAPDFAKSQPFAPAFLDSMAIVKDFWAEPSYASLLLPMQSPHPQLRRGRQRHGARKRSTVW